MKVNKDISVWELATKGAAVIIYIGLFRWRKKQCQMESLRGRKEWRAMQMANVFQNLQ